MNNVSDKGRDPRKQNIFMIVFYWV